MMHDLTLAIRSPRFLLKHRYSLYQNVTDDSQTARVDFIQSVLWRVPVGILNTKVDDVAGCHSPINERIMVVPAN